jgi:O-antigen/teichoic acid export membrane protein
MNHSSRFYSSIGLLILLNGVIKPIWIFAIDRQVQNVVGTDNYGIYFSLFNLSIVFSFLLDWGVTVFYNRQAAAQPAEFMNQAGSFLLLKFFFAIIYCAVICVIGYCTGITDWHLLSLIILIQVLTSFFIFIRSIVTARQFFKTDAWLSVMDKFLMIILCGSFFLFPAMTGTITLYRFLYLQIFATAFSIIFSVFLPGMKSIIFKPVRFSYFTRSFLLNALPFAIIVFLMSVHNRLDGFLLERLHANGAYEAGMYAAAYRLLDAFIMPGFLVTAFLLPYISRHFETDRDVENVIINSRHLLMMFSIGIISVVAVMAPWIQTILYHHDIFYGAEVLQLTLISMIGYSLVQVYGTLLTATGFIRRFVLITFISVAVNIFLNLLLIPDYGAKGCAIAAICTQGLSGVLLLFTASKRLQLTLHLRSILIYIFTFGLLLIVLKTGDWLQVNRWLLIGVAILITVGIMLMTKLFDYRRWKLTFH